MKLKNISLNKTLELMKFCIKNNIVPLPETRIILTDKDFQRVEKFFLEIQPKRKSGIPRPKRRQIKCKRKISQPLDFPPYKYGE